MRYLGNDLFVVGQGSNDVAREDLVKTDSIFCSGGEEREGSGEMDDMSCEIASRSVYSIILQFAVIFSHVGQKCSLLCHY